MDTRLGFTYETRSARLRPPVVVHAPRPQPRAGPGSCPRIRGQSRLPQPASLGSREAVGRISVVPRPALTVTRTEVGQEHGPRAGPPTWEAVRAPCSGTLPRPTSGVATLINEEAVGVGAAARR